MVYVKDNVMLREEQAADYPRINKDLPDYNPRGCNKGACFVEYVYGAQRVKYPLMRKGLRSGNPVERGTGLWERVTWDEALEYIADKLLTNIYEHGPDTNTFFSVIPAMSPISFAGGARLAHFLGGGSASPSARAGVGGAPVGTVDPEAPWRYTGPRLNAWEDFEVGGAGFKPTGARMRLVDDGGGQRSLEMTVDGERAPRAAAIRAVTLRLASARAVVLKLESRLARGADFALEFLAEDGSRYESAPVFVAPGTTWNLRVPLDREDFKSSRTGWTGYDSAFDRASAVRAIGLVLYPGAQRGSIRVDDIRIERPR